jgi:magnesium transporter
MPLALHGTVPGLPGESRPLWITAIAPTALELTRLSDEFGFDIEVLEHVLDPHERPRVRERGRTVLVVLRMPVFEGDGASVPYRTTPLGIVLGPSCGLTLCARESELTRRLGEYAEREVTHDVRHRMLLQAMELTGDAFLGSLDAVNGAVDAIEDRLQRSLENREVLQLLRYQKSLVDFAMALDGMHLLLQRFQGFEAFQVADEDRGWLEDVLVEFRQALDVSTMSRDVLSETMDAFATIISNNLNVVMKFLAAIAVILTFPVTLASFYGMNIPLPGQHSPHAFTWSVVASVAVGVLIAAYFRARRWL